MTNMQKKKCEQIMAHYGRGNQLDILQEECAEVIQAVSKVRRGTQGADEHFLDELADVSIMVEEFVSDMDDDEKTDYYKKINAKLDRQLDRIAKGEF